MQWDNTTLFSDDTPADRAFRGEVRAWIAQNCPHALCNLARRVDPPELNWPNERGGMGATLPQQIILLQEMSRFCALTRPAGDQQP